MKKNIRRIIIALLLIGGAYFAYSSFFGGNKTDAPSGMANPQSIEYTVKKQNFESSLSLEGKTKMKNEQNLQFNTNDRITAVNVAVGDTVKQGQILAKISTSQVDSNIENQRINLANANDKLNEFIKNAKNTELRRVNLDIQSAQLQINKKQYDIDYTKNKNTRDVNQARLSLQEAKNNLEILKKETAKNIAELERSAKTKDQVLAEKKLELEKLQREYDDFEKTFDTKLTTKTNEYYTKLETNFLSIGTQINEMEQGIKDIASIIGYKTSPVYYYNYFSAENPRNLGTIREYLKESEDILDRLKRDYTQIDMGKVLENIRNQKNTANLITVIKTTREFYDSWYKTTNAVSKGYQDSRESNDLSKQNILAHTQTYVKKATDAQTKINELAQLEEDLQSSSSADTIKKDLERELQQKKQALENAKLEIQKINNNQNYIVDTSGNNISNARIALNKKIEEVKQQEIDLEKMTIEQSEQMGQEVVALEKLKMNKKELVKKREELINISLNSEYKLAQNNVKQAQASYKEATEKLENYILKAPFDGVITKVDMKVGDRLTSESKKYISLVDPEAIEVNISVNQSNITKIKKGMLADITLSSYPNKVFSGTVFEVDTIPREENGVTVFSAKVVLKKPKDIEIYSGLSAKATIISHRIKNAIVVPFTAVSSDADGSHIVTVVRDGNKEKRSIKLGYTDGKFYEVLSGLKEGETVLEIDYSSAQMPGKPEKNGPSGGEGQGDMAEGSYEIEVGEY